MMMQVLLVLLGLWRVTSAQTEVQKKPEGPTEVQKKPEGPTEVQTKPEGPTELYRAMSINKTEEVLRLVRGKADPDEEVTIVDNCKSSLLHLAVSRGDAHVVRQLVFFGADPNRTTCFGQTPLHRAVREDKLEVVKALVGMPGIDPHREPFALSPIMLAVMRNKTDILSALFACSAHPDVPAKDGKTPLEVAVEMGFHEITNVLFRQGADVNYQHPDGDTYLHRAVRSQDLSGLIFFLANHADVDRVNYKGETPLTLAVNSKNTLFAGMILNRKKKLLDVESELYLVAESMQDDRLMHRLLLMGGRLPKQVQARSGYVDGGPRVVVIVQLREAVKTNMVGQVRKWVEMGANPNGQIDGEPMLHYALSQGYEDVVRELLEYGADPRAKSSDGWTPMCTAATHGLAAAVRQLAANGASLDELCPSGESPLYVATRRHHYLVVKVLLEMGADPNLAKIPEKWTPLHRAAFDGQVNLVRLLLDFRADPHLQDQSGLTASVLAQQRNHPDVTALLGKKSDADNKRLTASVGGGFSAGIGKGINAGLNIKLKVPPLVPYIGSKIKMLTNAVFG